MISNRQANALKLKLGAKGRAESRVKGMFLSLYYHDLARWLFVTLAFSGLISTGWWGIPLVPHYFIQNEVSLIAGLFTLFSALGTIWGVMAYREFRKSTEAIIDARDAARRLDPSVGDYEYKSYSPITREYEDGFVPSGPVDFWDKETQVPAWMDKGKYWHILLRLQGGSKEIRLKVVSDRDLPFQTGRRVVAETIRERVVGDEARRTRRYRYTVRVPQWLVMNTERTRFAGQSIEDMALSATISEINGKIVAATDEVTDWERQRIKYPWKAATLGIYLNKSLPIRIVYRQVIRNFPGAKKRGIEETNASLANAKDDALASALLELASIKGVAEGRLEMLRLLVRFLKNSYTRAGLGEGASEYHSFHHSLEVSYMALHLLPRDFQQFAFGPKDYELMLVAGLLHDYDPGQAAHNKQGMPKGPSVTRTMEEIQRTRILDAYFTMSPDQFADYFREYKSALLPPAEYATAHPEYVKTDWSPTESAVAEALIWRTDFPFFKQKLAQENFARLLDMLTGRGGDADRIKMMAEILWLSDLAVTYMGSDPVRAWDRVNNLYDELNLPKIEAVSRTDAFFTDFADSALFTQLIGMKQFPYVFRQRWNLIYQFFHEGNPSTQLNRTIATARKMYLKVNVEIGMKRGEMLQAAATDNYNWAEYFIGIGKDQSEVFKAKSRFAELDPQNASAFWGDTEKLLPSITDRSIDNFLMVMPEHSAPLSSVEAKASFRSLLAMISKKLVDGGALRILTDIGRDSAAFRELIAAAGQAGFQLADGAGKAYFPKDWRDPDFKAGSKPQAAVLVPK